MIKRSAIRRDYLLAQEVIISPGRAARPKNQKVTKSKIDQRVAASCFFCPEKLDYNNVIELLPANSAKKWQVAAINNIYPAVEMDNHQALGKQEVIIDTPRHEQSLAEVTIDQLAMVLKMYARRTIALSKQPPLDYILCLRIMAMTLEPRWNILIHRFLPPRCYRWLFALNCQQPSAIDGAPVIVRIVT
jgi:UDPglucose--hexose-1-phosphate uridylyltransferase